MLACVKAQGDIDYVIVYHFNRIFRNSIDAAITKRDLGKLGTRIISTVLHLDDSPESKMIETIMHAVDQYQSEASGADIAYKMGQKVKNGGSVGPAKLGYLNVRERIDGREIRTIAADPERAPLVHQAFELFASGQYTGPQLQLDMAEAGLRTRGDRRLPPQPLSWTRLYELLGDRYYLGYVTYKGDEHQGRHEPLIDEALFERAQRVLALRQEDPYLDLLDDPAWPEAKLKQKLADIKVERTEIDRQLLDTRSRLATGRQFFLLALDLLKDPQACYRQAGSDLRRAMNKVIFTKLYLDDTHIDRDDLAPGFQEIIQADRGTPIVDSRQDGSDTGANATDHIQGADGADMAVNVPAARTAPLAGRGSSKADLVEVAGIEPASADVEPGLLRAQPAVAFLSPGDPTGRSPSRAQSQ
jgi:Resolvase, N terminal domain/Recombinase